MFARSFVRLFAPCLQIKQIFQALVAWPSVWCCCLLSGHMCSSVRTSCDVHACVGPIDLCSIRSIPLSPRSCLSRACVLSWWMCSRCLEFSVLVHCFPHCFHCSFFVVVVEGELKRKIVSETFSMRRKFAVRVVGSKRADTMRPGLGGGGDPQKENWMHALTNDTGHVTARAWPHLNKCKCY